MGKKRLEKKISQDTTDLSEAVVDVQAADALPSDVPLFFVDTQGDSESRKSLKRRQHLNEQIAHAARAQVDLADATARAKRRESDRRMRKRQRTTPTPLASTAAAPRADEPLYDVWAGEPPPAASAPSPVPRTHRKLAGQFIAHAASSVRSAVEASKASLPHPGQSFHPAADDHEQLLTRAANHHAFLFQQNEAVRRQLNPDLFPTSDPTPSPSTTQPDLADSDSDSSPPGVPRPPTLDRRLTQAQRNRRRAIRLKAALHSQASASTALHRQLQRLPVILSALRRQQKVQERRRAVIARLKATRPDRQPRLGPYPQGEAAPPEVPLSEELTGSVREVRVSVNVVKDAMRRMEQRGMVEVRKRVKPHRRYALKEFERYKPSREEGVLPQYPRKGD